MNRPWFDTETGVLLLDEYVLKAPSFKKVMADGVVSPQELAEQAHHVIAALKRLEQILPPDARELATDALCELAVLYALERQRALSAG